MSNTFNSLQQVRGWFRTREPSLAPVFEWLDVYEPLLREISVEEALRVVRKAGRSPGLPGLRSSAETVRYLKQHEADMRQLVAECQAGRLCFEDVMPALLAETIPALLLYAQFCLFRLSRRHCAAIVNAESLHDLMCHALGRVVAPPGTEQPCYGQMPESGEIDSDSPDVLAALLVIAPAAPPTRFVRHRQEAIAA